MNATMRLGLSSVLLLLAGGLATYAPGASAQVAPLKNVGNGRCLAVNTTTGSAITQTCGISSIQIWSQANTGPGFLIKNVVTGNCLSSNAAGNVFTSTCNPAIPSQLWQRQNVGPTTARYKSIASGLFLSSTAAGGVFSGAPTGGPLQIWSY